MTHVTDEQLGKIARQLADLFRRVREGSLDAEEVSRRLQDIIEGKQRTGNLYPVTVDYGMHVDDAIRRGQYDWSNPNITNYNFPSKRKGTTEVVVELIYFDRFISTKDALRELDRMGYLPAELHELLAFGEKYPDVQRQFPVVALGSVWQGPYGRCGIPYLTECFSRRTLDLSSIGRNWNGRHRFAAVRK